MNLMPEDSIPSMLIFGCFAILTAVFYLKRVSTF